MTTATTRDLLPTDDEVAAYRRDGFYVSRQIIPADVLDAAEHGMERFYAGDVDAPFPGRTRFDHYDWTPEHGNVLRKNDYTSLMVHELGALVRSPAIGAVAARLAGAGEIRLWHDQLLYKPPGLDGATGNVGWHTDRQYWATCTSDDMLTAWVPFHDCDETTGTITFVPGSHRWDQSGLDFFDQDLATLEARISSPTGVIEKVSPRIPRGAVTFHHCRTVHGSGPNVSGRPRRSMAVHLQPGDNRHRAGVDADGTPLYHRNDELCRSVHGQPDYTDPAFFPVLWPSARP
jgi:ectoine hydroxylase-related dioxygenase (phytanoyl-CoA dioxygenase family)